MPLPEWVNAMRAITYNVPDIVVSLIEEDPDNPPTDEQVMEYIFDLIATDFDGFDGVIIQDEDGNEL